jgi:hypothetical protein
MSVDATVLSMLVDAVREVKESVTQLSRDLSEQLGRLPNTYVPRQEVRQWVDDLIIDHGQERAERKTEIAELRAQIATVEERRRSDRWQAITAALALAGLGLTALVLIISHWK